MLTAASVMKQRPRIGGRVDREHVADASRVRRPVSPCDDRAHQFVGVQRALHQRLDLAGARHRHRLRRGGVAVLGRDDLETGNVEPMRRGGSRIFRSGPISTGAISSSLAASIAPMQRSLVDRMDDRRPKRLHRARRLDELRIAAALLVHFGDIVFARFGRRRRLRRDHLRGPGHGQVAVLVGGAHLDRDVATFRALRGDLRHDGHDVARAGRRRRLDRLTDELGAGPRQPPGDQRAHQRACPAGLSRVDAEGARGGDRRVDEARPHRRGLSRQQRKIFRRQRMDDAVSVADLQLVERPVSNWRHHPIPFTLTRSKVPAARSPR